jgi:L-fucose mutarotase
VADANFTAASLGRGKPVITLPGAGVERTSAALLSLLPLDAAVAQPVAYMKVCDTPDGYRSALQRRAIELQRRAIDAFETAGWLRAGQCAAMERFSFYERVQQAFAIVHTGELQPYANFLFKKGVIGEPLAT